MFSVGVLYSSHTFLRMVEETPLYSSSFPEMFEQFEVATGESVLQATQLCEWAVFGRDGGIHISKRGEEVLAAGSPEARLRIQLKQMITYLRPAWAVNLCTGRVEATKSLPEDALQCFNEAGLLEGYDHDTITWWDEAANVARLLKDSTKSSGRLGELFSRNYELERVGAAPYWEGFESNFAGYDLLSKVNRNDPSRLLIEVKACQSKLRDGQFWVSRGEWDTATRSENYVFHLWVMKPQPRLLIVSKDDITSHVPQDKGDGQWRSALLQMSPFTGNEVSLPKVVIETA